jgi:hypothetical protein
MIAVGVAIVATVAGILAFLNLMYNPDRFTPEEDGVNQTNFTNQIILVRTQFTERTVSYSVESVVASGTPWNKVSLSLGWGRMYWWQSSGSGVTWFPSLGELDLDGVRAYHAEWESNGAKAWFNLTDADGDMMISHGDSFTIETSGWVEFDSGTSYAVTITGAAYTHAHLQW